MTLPCFKCNGDGWLRKIVTMPPRFYGKEVQITQVAPCPCCKAKGEITTTTDHKQAAAGGR